ncbi:MAG: lipoyl synthase [Pleurocapsa sp. SU_196_0]|nr:lipoyl synthase [Pleurocapsa sp. SU_196_0]
MIKPAREYDFPVVKDGIHLRDAPPVVRERKPDWLKVPLPSGIGYKSIRDIVDTHGLATVCQEAMCPNIAECWAAGTATFMLMGSVCTRACKFCAVNTGNPQGRLDPLEPAHIADAVDKMGLQYVVLTSVDRDDLPDGGSSHFARTVRTIKSRTPQVKVEALTPDFGGNLENVAEVVGSGIEVYAQNLETVRRLTHPVRDARAGYDQTLGVLAGAKKVVPDIITKTSLMLGLGETRSEILETMRDVRESGVDIVTFGQYLRPTRNHLPVERYVTPEEFEEIRLEGLALGFMEVVSGALVRSSYRAEQVWKK